MNYDSLTGQIYGGALSARISAVLHIGHIGNDKSFFRWFAAAQHLVIMPAAFYRVAVRIAQIRHKTDIQF